MPTPHIEALKEEIAETVIMPGDPMRAKFIADTYLENVTCINDVRGMLGYTGFYKGKRLTVMGSGMGAPSMGIYSYELYKFYDVKEILRIGSCGSFVPNLNLFDLVLVEGSFSDSAYARVQNGSMDTLIYANKELNEKIEEKAKDKGINIVKGNIYSTDVFYKEQEDYNAAMQNNCLAVEMESFALFHNARVLGKKAACILTVSDSLITKEQTTSEEREKQLKVMMELALDSCME